MMTQLAFPETPTRVPTKRDLILAVLKRRSGQWVGGEEFMDGRWGFRCSSYSQRIGQLIRAGHLIERERDGGLGRYRLHEEAT